MNLEERIKAGMLFYESGHVDPVNQEIEERLDNERKDCKELMFDYNHCRPGDQDRRLKILKELLGSCGDHVTDAVRCQKADCSNGFLGDFSL